MQRTLMCSVAAVALTWATVAAADPPRLKGEYAFTTTLICLVAPGTGPATPGVARANAGFNANLTPVDGGEFANSSGIEGIYTLDGNGHGTVKSTSVTLNVSPPGGVLLIDTSYAITYAVNADGSWKADLVPGSFLTTFTGGTRAGQTSTLDKLSQVGLIGEDAKTLTLSSLDGAVETQSFSNGDVFPRICQRSTVLTKMPQRDDDGGDHD
jgi:hypothetical protein